MTSKRKKAMKKKRMATRLKAKKMKTTLLGATPRRTRYSTMPTKSKLLEINPDPHWQTKGFVETYQHHHSARI
jgi:hypothetical protein